MPMSDLSPEGSSGRIIEVAHPKTKKKRVIRTKHRALEGDENAPIDVDDEQAKPEQVRGRDKQSKKRKPRKEWRERSPTPSDAEDQVVDTNTFTMTDLCKDLRIGRKFSRHDDIKQREDDKKAAAKSRRLTNIDPEDAALSEGLQNGKGEARDAGTIPVQPEDNAQLKPATIPAHSLLEVSPEPPRLPGQSVMMRIVDGQIVVDERSIQIDRHRLAQEETRHQDIVEENDFTRVITSATYMRREQNKRWDWSSMEKFYNGLKSFGTDFGLIANMFPGRTRKQIKLLFNREERCNPELIKRTLAGDPIPINFQEYTEMSGKTYVEVSEIAAESQALDDQHRAELAAIEYRSNAANKKKKDAIHGRNAARDMLDVISDDDDDDGHVNGNASTKENRAPSAGAAGSRSREASTTTAGGHAKRGKKGGKQSKANKHSMRAGGEVVEIVGSIN